MMRPAPKKPLDVRYFCLLFNVMNDEEGYLGPAVAAGNPTRDPQEPSIRWREARGRFRRNSHKSGAH